MGPTFVQVVGTEKRRSRRDVASAGPDSADVISTYGSRARPAAPLLSRVARSIGFGRNSPYNPNEYYYG
jgi:hypothetical protein